ncbi:hypothetical protein D9M68_818120 [compost metagenome]
MRGVEVALRRQLAGPGEGVVPGHQADHVVLQQHRQVQVLGWGGPVAYDDIHFALGQGPFEVEAFTHWQGHQPGLGRLHAEAPDHIGEEGWGEGVRYGEGEGAIAAFGVERLVSGQQVVEGIEGGLGILGELQATFGGHHAVLLADHQGVAKDMPQPLEGTTDGRL